MAKTNEKFEYFESLGKEGKKGYPAKLIFLTEDFPKKPKQTTGVGGGGGGG